MDVDGVCAHRWDLSTTCVSEQVKVSRLFPLQKYLCLRALTRRRRRLTRTVELAQPTSDVDVPDLPATSCWRCTTYIIHNSRQEIHSCLFSLDRSLSFADICQSISQQKSPLVKFAKPPQSNEAYYSSYRHDDDRSRMFYDEVDGYKTTYSHYRSEVAHVPTTKRVFIVFITPIM